jgi:hypothetical protein
MHLRKRVAPPAPDQLSGGAGIFGLALEDHDIASCLVNMHSDKKNEKKIAPEDYSDLHEEEDDDSEALLDGDVERDEDGKIRSFPCHFDACSYTAISQSHLNIHVRSHTGEKSYRCKYKGCKYAATTAGNLKKHIRTHTGETPHKCHYDGCSYSATQSSDLKLHIRTHTGEKPYKCTHTGCLYAATTASNLNKHRKTHTKKESGASKAGAPLPSPTADLGAATSSTEVEYSGVILPCPTALPFDLPVGARCAVFVEDANEWREGIIREVKEEGNPTILNDSSASIASSLSYSYPSSRKRKVMSETAVVTLADGVEVSFSVSKDTYGRKRRWVLLTESRLNQDKKEFFYTDNDIVPQRKKRITPNYIREEDRDMEEEEESFMESEIHTLNTSSSSMGNSVSALTDNDKMALAEAAEALLNSSACMDAIEEK